MALAIFDLDNTLIANDSDHLWGEFMASHGLVDSNEFRTKNDYFYKEYVKGTLNIYEYLNFCLKPLSNYSLIELKIWHDRFMKDDIHPIMLQKGHDLITKHREQGDYIMIITATSRFVTGPIAEAFNVDTLLAIEPEIINNRYTGKTVGVLTYQEGKVTRLNEWLIEHPELSMEGSTFYSDSKNDLPLLKLVTHPVAVDPDPELKKHAKQKGWPIISLR
ncbi:phosphoserine phosphatase [Endozoicomonas sp. (ex Bugula neritina AB1)]|nr:phosphoserine phosphatase [Endozoicomonas sp. (ex Bugula neritina AB1)]